MVNYMIHVVECMIQVANYMIHIVNYMTEVVKRVSREVNYMTKVLNYMRHNFRIKFYYLQSLPFFCVNVKREKQHLLNNDAHIKNNIPFPFSI